MTQFLSTLPTFEQLETYLYTLSVSASRVLAILAGCLTVILIIRKLAEKWWLARRDRQLPTFLGRVHLYLMSGDILLRQGLVTAGFWDRILLKDIILTEGERDDLPERGRLSDLYRDLGWVEKDKKTLINSWLWWKRAAAAHHLGQLGVRDAQPHLQKALDDKNVEVRLEATWALGHMGFVEDLPRIVSSMAEFFKIAALRMDAFIFDMGKPALPILMDLCREGDFEVRLLAIHLVGEFKDPQSLSLLIPLLDSDNLEIRMAACKAIGSIGNENGLTVLKPYLKDHTWQLRAQVARQFGRNAFKAAVSSVSEGLTDKEWWVRYNSGEALSLMGPEGKLALQTATSSPDRFARDMAAQWLDELEATAA